MSFFAAEYAFDEVRDPPEAGGADVAFSLLTLSSSAVVGTDGKVTDAPQAGGANVALSSITASSCAVEVSDGEVTDPSQAGGAEVAFSALTVPSFAVEGTDVEVTYPRQAGNAALACAFLACKDGIAASTTADAFGDDDVARTIFVCWLRSVKTEALSFCFAVSVPSD